jgi:hypothetical protein
MTLPHPDLPKPSRPRHRIPSLAVWAPLALAPFLGASPAAAQGAMSPSILTLLNPGTRTVERAAMISGSLTEADYVALDGSPVQAWRYRGTGGEDVTFDLVSDEFDAVLYLLGPGIDGGYSDDDGGGACNSRISVTLPESGEYLLVVGALGAGTTGTFLLGASPEPGPPTGEGSCSGGGAWDPSTLGTIDTGGRQIASRGEGVGTITEVDRQADGTLLQAWELRGTAGEEITVDVISDDFDAFLLVWGPGFETPLADDDGGGQCHSRISTVLPESGSYRLVVSTIGDFQEGVYTLRTSAAPGPIAPGTCSAFDEILGALQPDLNVLAFAETGGRTLPATGPVSGEITDGDERYPGGGGPMQAWLYVARAGETVTFDLESDDFDSFMAIAGPGLAAPVTDDDGGAGFSSRITLTFPEAGEYRIVATSVGMRTGRYTLTVTPGGE